MTKVSREFLIRLKLHSLPAYLVAQKAGISGTTLSKLINRIEPVRRGDDRVLAVGRILGLSPGDCFEKATKKHEVH